MIITDIRRELTRGGDPKKYEPIRYYFNHTKLKMYGASTPVQRKIAKEWTRRHQDAPTREVLALVSALYCAPSFDERLMASYILSQNTRVIPGITEVQWNRWIAHIENWAVSDALSTDPFGAWLLADRSRGVHYLKQLIESKNIWARRVALVGLMWVNREDASIPVRDLSFAFIKKTMHERDVIITKAISWILRTVADSYPAAVQAFIAKYENDLPAIAKRETLNKIQTGRKSGKKYI